MSASPWAKEWKSLASDSSQKAFLLATFYKAFGIWPTDIPQEAVQKLVAGRNPDDIHQSRRLRLSPGGNEPSQSGIAEPAASPTELERDNWE
jgi:hypothetical protein